MKDKLEKTVKDQDKNMLFDGNDLQLIVGAIDSTIRQPNSNIPNLSALRFKVIGQGIKAGLIEVK